MDSDPADVAIPELHLAGMNSGSQREADRRHLLDDPHGAGHRPSRSIESGDASIAGHLDLATSKPLKL